MTNRTENAIAWFVAGSILTSALAGWACLDILVSLQYETNGPNECVSLITQRDLCRSLKLAQATAIGSLLVALLITLAAWLRRSAPKQV